MAKRKYVIEYVGSEGDAHQFLVRTPKMKPMEIMQAENVVNGWLLDQTDSQNRTPLTRTSDHTLKLGLRKLTDIVRFDRRFGPISGLSLDAIRPKQSETTGKAA